MADKGYMVIDARHIDDVAKKILTGSTVKSFVADGICEWTQRCGVCTCQHIRE